MVRQLHSVHATMMHGLYLVLAGATLLGACSSSDDLDARFRDASPELRARAVNAATGHDASMALLLFTRLSTSESGVTCPEVTRSEGTVTVRGGCQIDQTRIDGTMRLEKAGFYFDDFEYIDAANPENSLLADGAMTFSEETRADYDIRITFADVTTETDIGITCRMPGIDCAATPGSTVFVEGIGRAAVEMTRTNDFVAPYRNKGLLELRGAETLRYEMTGQTEVLDDQGRFCDPITIDGEDAGVICLEH